MKSASIVFYQGNSVLCAKGYSTRGLYSGIGGTIEQTDSTPAYAAIREAIEELFEVRAPAELLNYFASQLTVHYIPLQYPSHVTYYLTFNHLETIMQECKRQKLKSPLYKVFPTTIQQLLNRRIIGVAGELYDLKIHSASYILNTPLFTREFKQDVRRLVA